MKLPCPTEPRSTLKKKRRGELKFPLLPFYWQWQGAKFLCRTMPTSTKKRKKGEPKLPLLLAMEGPTTPRSIKKTKQSKKKGESKLIINSSSSIDDGRPSFA
jgi:hypothetical protein